MELVLIGIGAIIGLSVTSVIYYKKTAYGMLLIDHSDPEKDVYQIKLNNLDELSKKKRIILHVDNNADLR